ncbi:MAG: hypothetical protein IKH92_03100 [Clostridiales bacterium]|nr:hypothetical protein [Clostridiales bacterium]
MKKAISVLLCMATVFTCVACGSKDTKETRKKKKTKRTTETEESLDPSLTTDTSESETEETTTVPEPKNEFVISHDLTSEKIKSMRDTMMYTAVDTTKQDDGFPMQLSSVDVEYDVLTSEGGATKISGILNEYVWHTADASSRIYEQELTKFKEKESAHEELPNFWYDYDSRVIRSDSQILSLGTTVSGYSSEDFIVTTTRYENYRSEDGSEIGFDDVILDKDAFVEYLDDYLVLINRDRNPVMSQITEGSFTFGMTYDGLIIGDDKLPVIGHEDIFDMSYFGSTPENYTLLIDRSFALKWDFNGDNQMDDLSLSVTMNQEGYAVDALHISFCGKDYVFEAKDYEEMDYMEELDPYGGNCVMCIGGKYYLLVAMDSEGEDYATYIFDINGDEPKFVEFFYSTAGNTLDPTDFTISLRTDIVGTVFMNYGYGLGTDGHLISLSTMGKCNSGPYLSMMPLSGKNYDVTTGTMGEDNEVPAGECVEVLGFDTKSGILVVRVHPSRDNLEPLTIALETDKRSKIAGQDRDSAFIGLMYAD